MAISTSKLIIGICLILFGLLFIILSILTTLFMLIYGIPLVILGIFIMFNKNEDKIEKRKDLKEKVYNK